DRLHVAFDAKPIFPGPGHLIAHQHRIAARRAKLRAGRVGERRPGDLAEEGGDARQRVAAEVARDARAELVLSDDERLALDRAARATNAAGQHAERRTFTHRIAARDPNFDVAVLLAQLLQKLLNEARFADTGGRGDDDGARDGLGERLFGESNERR